jgi:hypothetical protein
MPRGKWNYAAQISLPYLGRRRAAELGGGFFFQEEVPYELPQFQVPDALDEFASSAQRRSMLWW